MCSFFNFQFKKNVQPRFYLLIVWIKKKKFYCSGLILCWTAPDDCEVDHYIVQYFRDQWQLWLR